MKITEIYFCDSNINKRRLFLAMEATETACIAEIIHREISPDDRYLLRKSQKDYVFLLNIQKKACIVLNFYVE
ncbi:hypothetical protein [Streptococcus thermophilus]|uniref:hypothetical protein n=1 Tax=Streptococcus thermophilus TaxID=1308 RepID=UPI0021A417A0|nr:hypothetical protein [Streptococcus thermophilus]MCT2957445.1 hypothetical protein [Streptococcus thermophilus]